MTNFLLFLILIALLGGGAFLVSSAELFGGVAWSFIKEAPRFIFYSIVFSIIYVVIEAAFKKLKSLLTRKNVGNSVDNSTKTAETR